MTAKIGVVHTVARHDEEKRQANIFTIALEKFSKTHDCELHWSTPLDKPINETLVPDLVILRAGFNQNDNHILILKWAEQMRTWRKEGNQLKMIVFILQGGVRDDGNFFKGCGADFGFECPYPLEKDTCEAMFLAYVPAFLPGSANTANA